MKREGRKIAAAVVYDYQMARICERAGAELLSVGDSLGRNVLGQEDVDDCLVEDMLPFARAVVRARESAIVSVDLPTTASRGGPEEVAKAAQLFKAAGVDMMKVDIRTHEEELFENVKAVISIGLGAYPQIGFPTQGASRGIRSGDEVRDHVMKWAHAIEAAGGAAIDLTNVTPDIYKEVCESVQIPVLGGQAPPEADGKIQVAFGISNYAASNIDRADDKPNAARDFYQNMKRIIDDIHGGKWAAGQATL
jgi:3-methyl-2-oxobutanoate hydroxymethyltransferase